MSLGLFKCIEPAQTSLIEETMPTELTCNCPLVVQAGSMQ